MKRNPKKNFIDVLLDLMEYRVGVKPVIIKGIDQIDTPTQNPIEDL
jgi:hypothetical protein